MNLDKHEYLFKKWIQKKLWEHLKMKTSATTNINSIRENISRLNTEISSLREHEIKVKQKMDERYNGLNKTINSLPSMFNVPSIAQVIQVLSQYLPKRGRKPKINEFLEYRVLTMIKQGKTGREIGEALDLSLPTIQKIKDQNGLVRHHQKAA